MTPLDPERMHLATPLAVARENLEVELEEVLAEMARHARVEVRAAAIQGVCTIQRRLGIIAVLTEARHQVILGPSTTPSAPSPPGGQHINHISATAARLAGGAGGGA